MSTLSVTNLQKSYGDHAIIHNMSLSVEKGEFIVVVGPSGCGKSTLLRMIAGLEEITAGEIAINERVINKLEPKDRNIAMVFQNYALYPHMTVYNNMAYGLKRRALKKDEIEERIQTTAEILGIKELLTRKPGQLSGGQRQRVAMGRAIVRKPDLFLFDEPLSNLDANLRGQMRLEIRKLQKRLKTTTFYVTHDQVEAMTLADRIVLMNAGRIEQIATPQEIYQHPASMFVAGFMGSPPMNFLSAKISPEGDAVIIHGGTHLPLNFSISKERWNQPVILGIRPESIIKSTKEGADLFNLTVNLVESLGGEKLIYGTFLGDEQTVTVRLPNKVETLIGEELKLGVMPDALHLFDIESKTRIIN